MYKNSSKLKYYTHRGSRGKQPASHWSTGNACQKTVFIECRFPESDIRNYYSANRHTFSLGIIIRRIWKYEPMRHWPVSPASPMQGVSLSGSNFRPVCFISIESSFSVIRHQFRHFPLLTDKKPEILIWVFGKDAPYYCK